MSEHVGMVVEVDVVGELLLGQLSLAVISPVTQHLQNLILGYFHDPSLLER